MTLTYIVVDVFNCGLKAVETSSFGHCYLQNATQKRKKIEVVGLATHRNLVAVQYAKLLLTAKSSEKRVKSIPDGLLTTKNPSYGSF